MKENSGKPSLQRVRIAGMDEMYNLAAAAVSALETACLFDEARELHSRVLARSPESLVETVMLAPNVCRWEFKPIVELLLREIPAVASATDLPIEERRSRIRWALEVSGF